MVSGRYNKKYLNMFVCSCASEEFTKILSLILNHVRVRIVRVVFI
jgi:hypothetical protein